MPPAKLVTATKPLSGYTQGCLAMASESVLSSPALTLRSTNVVRSLRSGATPFGHTPFVATTAPEEAKTMKAKNTVSFFPRTVVTMKLKSLQCDKWGKPAQRRMMPTLVQLTVQDSLQVVPGPLAIVGSCSGAVIGKQTSPVQSSDA